MYENRFYRQELKRTGWFSYEITLSQTDLHILSKDPLDQKYIYERTEKYRNDIQNYIKSYPEFETTLSAFELKGGEPPIVKEMIENTLSLDVGPMACVAGALAEFLGKDLGNFTSGFVIENGGDICIKKKGKISIGIYAGPGNIANNFFVSLQGKDAALGVCSSSSFLGHSLSLGSADLVTIISESTIFADGLATKIANRINTGSDVSRKIEELKEKPFVLGALIVKGDKIGLWGNLELEEK